MLRIKPGLAIYKTNIFPAVLSIWPHLEVFLKGEMSGIPTHLISPEPIILWHKEGTLDGQVGKMLEKGLAPG